MKPKAEHRRTWEGIIGRFHSAESAAGSWPQLILVPTGPLTSNCSPRAVATTSVTAVAARLKIIRDGKL